MLLVQPYGESASFAGFTFHRYASTMLLGHGFDIKQAEAVAFHIVQIAGGNAVELIEYMLLLFGSDTDSPVADRNFNAVPLFRGGDLSASKRWRERLSTSQKAPPKKPPVLK